MWWPCSLYHVCWLHDCWRSPKIPHGQMEAWACKRQLSAVARLYSGDSANSSDTFDQRACFCVVGARPVRHRGIAMVQPAEAGEEGLLGGFRSRDVLKGPQLRGFTRFAVFVSSVCRFVEFVVFVYFLGFGVAMFSGLAAQTLPMCDQRIPFLVLQRAARAAAWL